MADGARLEPPAGEHQEPDVFIRVGRSMPLVPSNAKRKQSWSQCFLEMIARTYVPNAGLVQAPP